jgi:hypothetical protein
VSSERVMAITLEERVFGCIVTGEVNWIQKFRARYGFHGEASEYTELEKLFLSSGLGGSLRELKEPWKTAVVLICLIRSRVSFSETMEALKNPMEVVQQSHRGSVYEPLT